MPRSVARLIRLPNLATAVADSWAGLALCATASPDSGAESPALWALLALSSASMYAAGAVFNDLADRGRDRILHPERPLVTGAIRSGAAAVAGTSLLLAAVAAAFVAGPERGTWALACAAAVCLYDFSFKRWVIPGALAMGAARTANMLVGIGGTAALTARVGPLGLWVYPALLGLHAMLLTLASTREEGVGVRALMGPVALLDGLVLAIPLLGGPAAAGAVLAAAYALGIGVTGLWVAARNDPRAVAQYVRVGVHGLPLWDAACVLGQGQTRPGLAILGLFMIVLITAPVTRST